MYALTNFETGTQSNPVTHLYKTFFVLVFAIRKLEHLAHALVAGCLIRRFVFCRDVIITKITYMLLSTIIYSVFIIFLRGRFMCGRMFRGVIKNISKVFSFGSGM